MSAADRCPGVLRPHRAEDGLMIRLRLPGGQTTSATLAGLGALAAAYGNPELQLTTRAGVQLRGLPDPVPDSLVSAVADLGLLPSATHELARTIVASPLTGLDGGLDDVRDLVRDLDVTVQRRPALALLSGRFCFAVDDGRGDVTQLPYDLAYQARGPAHGVILAGPDHGIPVARPDAVRLLVDLAERFLADSATRPGRGWQVRDVPDWASQVAEPAVARRAPGDGVAYGRVGDAASVHVPLGLLSPGQLAAIAAQDGPVVITPWRGLVLPGATHRLPALAAAGFIVAESSPWTRLSACVGAPHCARTTVDTRRIATDLVRDGQVDRRTHVSGCERRCGAPTGAHAELVAAP